MISRLVPRIVLVGLLSMTGTALIPATGLTLPGFGIEGAWASCAPTDIASPSFEDPTISPGAGWVWVGNGPVGSAQGNWYNSEHDSSLHPDLAHPPPIGPHYDFKDWLGRWFRWFPDGSIVPK